MNWDYSIVKVIASTGIDISVLVIHLWGCIMDIKKTGNKLVLSIDLVDIKTAPASASGKSKVAFSTHGFNWTDMGLGISCNVIYSNK